jgi:hypothetical protein
MKTSTLIKLFQEIRSRPPPIHFMKIKLSNIDVAKRSQQNKNKQTAEKLRLISFMNINARQ